MRNGATYANVHSTRTSRARSAATSAAATDPPPRQTRAGRRRDPSGRRSCRLCRLTAPIWARARCPPHRLRPNVAPRPAPTPAPNEGATWTRDSKPIDVERIVGIRLPTHSAPAAALPDRDHPGPDAARGPDPGRIRAPDDRGPRGTRARRHRCVAAPRRAQPGDEPWAPDLGRRPAAVRAGVPDWAALAREPDRGRRGAARRGRRRSRARPHRPPGAHPGGDGLPRRRDRPIDRSDRRRDADAALSGPGQGPRADARQPARLAP